MHLIIILAIVLIIFGPGRLPELGRGLGKSIREFKKAMSEAGKNIEVAPEPKERPKEVTSPTTTEMKQETASKDRVEVKKDTTV